MYDRFEDEEIKLEKGEPLPKSNEEAKSSNNCRLNRVMNHREGNSGENHYEIICNLDFDGI